MKYRKNGRTYRLVSGFGCKPCAFFAKQKTESCPYAQKETQACFTASRNPTVWRETLFSKIRNWRGWKIKRTMRNVMGIGFWYGICLCSTIVTHHLWQIIVAIPLTIAVIYIYIKDCK